MVVFNKRSMTTSVIHIDDFENDVFLIHEKIRIFISKYDPDYYVMVGEAWTQKTRRFNSMYQQIIDMVEESTSQIMKKRRSNIFAKTKNSSNPGPDKFELYEIIREKQNDEKSKILESENMATANLRWDIRI